MRHSLKITQILSRIRRVFELDLPFAELFQEPTIAEEAAQIAKQRGKDPITNPDGQSIIKRRTTFQKVIQLRTV